MRRAAAAAGALLALGLLTVPPAAAALRGALLVTHRDQYGRPVSGPEVSLRTFAQAGGLSFAYVGRPGTADFDFELYRATPVGALAVDFRQDGAPAGVALRR